MTRQYWYSRRAGAAQVMKGRTAAGRKCSWLALGVAVLLSAGCTPLPAERDKGATTFVSLNPCVDAILVEVADPAQVLAISHYSHDPRATSMPMAQAKRYRASGGSVEEVLALAPDVVLSDSFLQPAARHALGRLGLRVETFGIAASPAETRNQIRRLAALTGHVARGEALIRRIDLALAETRHSGSPLTALLWQQGGLVPGEETLAARLLRHTGFVSHSAARGLGQGAYLGLEQVLADPPDVVIAAGGERLLAHPALRRTPGMAYRTLDPALLFCGGPSMIRAVKRLSQIRAQTARFAPGDGA